MPDAGSGLGEGRCLARALPGWDEPLPAKRRHVIGAIPGEGVGPEVIGAALDILATVGWIEGVEFEVREGGPIGHAAAASSGCVLPPEVIEFCTRVFADEGAILCGPGGGRFVYELRSRFDLYCKLTPVKPAPALNDTGVVRAQATAGADMVVVRENIGGFYAGHGERVLDAHGEPIAAQTCVYRAQQVRRILAVAADLAARRRGRLAIALKPGGVPAVSALWREEAERLVDHRIHVEFHEADNLAYQLVADAGRFDVVAAPNLFGDLLADCASLLLASRGLSYSGNFGAAGIAVYQTGHGAARDLAGTDRANPAGQILSLAMLLRESFGLYRAAARIESALERTFREGWRTPDIRGTRSRLVGTRSLARRVAETLERSASRTPALP